MKALGAVVALECARECLLIGGFSRVQVGVALVVALVAGIVSGLVLAYHWSR